MFFPEKIKNIKKTDRVLDVGPGAFPHPRADVLLDKKFSDNFEEKAQRGYADPPKTEKRIVYYDGGKFPFMDNEFDYVICSHVLEHIEKQDLDLFLLELQRVAKRGYIEFPTILYELINYPDVHVWFMNYRENTIYFLDKAKFSSNFVHKSFREMFYAKDKYMYKAFTKYKEVFFSGFEWENHIDYRVVNNYDELLNENDYLKIKNYFSNYQEKSEEYTISTMIKTSFLALRNLLEFIMKYSPHR